MGGYEVLAGYYDRLTRDIDYESFASFYEEIFEREDIQVSSVVDLACGTGSLTDLMARRGYDMTGVDVSPEMLIHASGKNRTILYLNQPLEELDLYGTYDAAICSLDGINHIEPENITNVFRRINMFLNPGGLFIFDILPPPYFQELDGETLIDEDEDIYCLWRADFDFNENCCRYGFDFFIRRDDRLYERSSEEYTEYAHSTEFLIDELTRAGFTRIKQYGDRMISESRETNGRIFISAMKREL